MSYLICCNPVRIKMNKDGIIIATQEVKWDEKKRKLIPVSKWRRWRRTKNE